MSLLGLTNHASTAGIYGTQMASPSRTCGSTTQCTYVADQIGGVQVFSGHSLIASLPIRTTPSDPYTCPTTAYFWFGSILVSDPCGNFDQGELRVLNPATNAWGSPITLSGPTPVYMVGDPSNGDLYVANFGFGTVTVLSSPTAIAGIVGTCAPNPEFLDYDSSSKLVFVGNRGLYTPACLDRIKGTTPLAPITHAGSYIFSFSDSFTGVTANQATGNVYVNDYSYGIGGIILEFSSTGAYLNALLPPSLSEGIWGSTYDVATQSVDVVSSSQFNSSNFSLSEQGFVFAISSHNAVGRPVLVGDVPQAACYNPADQSIYVPNFEDPSYPMTVVKGFHATSIFYYGVVEGFGCGAN
jgi:hypothetical protein